MTSKPNEKQRFESASDDALAEQAIQWFARLRASDLSAEEDQRFQRWLAENPAHSRAYREIVEFWDDPDFGASLEETSPSPSTTPRASQKPNRFYLRFAFASVLAIAWIWSLNPWLLIQADYRTEPGQRETIVLADGSTITLNTDSAIAVDLNAEQRRVHLLRGEALFAVRRDESRPFLVDSANARVRVLGTRFLVREEPDSDRVTVFKGVVEVTTPNQAAQSVLEQYDQVLVNDRNLEPLAPATPDQESAWRQGYLTFRNTSLSEVAGEIERFLPGRIYLIGSEIRDYSINARLDITDPDASLRALETTLPIKISRLGPWLTLIHKY